MTHLLHQRLLDRAALGGLTDAKSADFEPAAWLDRQLRAPAPEASSKSPAALAGFDSLGLDGSEMRRDPEMRREIRRHSRETARETAGERLRRAAHAPEGERLREVMIDFWANHFAVDARTSFVGGLLPHYLRSALEPHALGRFEDLLLAVARSPAMLVYLDNWRSTVPRRGRRNTRERGGINENYARELLELHTLGIDGGYEQRDVVEVARILTGWGLARGDGARFRFHERLHDPGSKRVLGRRYADDGAGEGERLLRDLARHPATARHVTRKLVRRFVAEAPPPGLVERARQRFLETEGDLGQVLRTILLAPEMSDAENRKLKTPLRFAVGAVRATGGTIDGGRGALLALARLGELPFFPGSPAGFPEDERRWADPGLMLERMSFAFAAARGWIPGVALGELPVGATEPGLPRHARVAISIASPEFQWS